MKLKRRSFLAGLAAGTAPLAASASWNSGTTTGSHRLLIIDSRVEGLTPVTARNSSDQLIDLATLSDSDWFRLSQQDTSMKCIDGYCRWQDFVVLRDIFRDHGFRLTQPESRLDTAEGHSLFFWQMKTRG